MNDIKDYLGKITITPNKDGKYDIVIRGIHFVVDDIDGFELNKQIGTNNLLGYNINNSMNYIIDTHDSIKFINFLKKNKDILETELEDHFGKSYEPVINKLVEIIQPSTSEILYHLFDIELPNKLR
jgi:hypothetical protein